MAESGVYQNVVMVNVAAVWRFGAATAERTWPTITEQCFHLLRYLWEEWGDVGIVEAASDTRCAENREQSGLLRQNYKMDSNARHPSSADYF